MELTARWVKYTPCPCAPAVSMACLSQAAPIGAFLGGGGIHLVGYSDVNQEPVLSTPNVKVVISNHIAAGTFPSTFFFNSQKKLHPKCAISECGECDKVPTYVHVLQTPGVAVGRVNLMQYVHVSLVQRQHTKLWYKRLTAAPFGILDIFGLAKHKFTATCIYLKPRHHNFFLRGKGGRG